MIDACITFARCSRHYQRRTSAIWFSLLGIAATMMLGCSRTADNQPAANGAHDVRTAGAESERDQKIRLAAQGNAQAQFDLGKMYANGDSVAKDDAEAVKWYRKAADQGFGKAQNNLGLMYYNGNGVTKDNAEAVKWYRRAADQGLALAQLNLGLMYARGDGAPKDGSEAVKWYSKAANQGNADAQNNLGGVYHTGSGVLKDDTEAVKWFRLAADQRMAAAQFNLGGMYYTGSGVPEDHAEAAKWFRKAADQDLHEAENNLGSMYANGDGVTEDNAEAGKWFRKAAATVNNGTGTEPNGRSAPSVDPLKQSKIKSIEWLTSTCFGGKKDAFTVLDAQSIYSDSERESYISPIICFLDIRFRTPWGMVKRTASFACDANGNVIVPLTLPDPAP